jgi:hypothetical protein
MSSKIKIKIPQIFQIKTKIYSDKIRLLMKKILQARTKISCSQFYFLMVKIKYKMIRSSKILIMLKDW